MAENDFAEDIRAAWQGSPLTDTLLRRNVRWFALRTRAADAIAVLFQAAFVPWWAAFAWGSETLLCRIGCALLALAAAYTLVRLVSFCFVGRLPSEPGAATAAFYRAELRRRLAGQESLAQWVVWPAVPGLVLAIIGWAASSPEQWKEIVGVIASWVGVHYAYVLQSREAAAKLRKEIALLDCDTLAPRHP
ncbi:MAG: hypothetical protein U0Q16_21770 [Bryobacteraceae bacterium]